MTFIFREATENDYLDIIDLHKRENWGIDTPTALKKFQQKNRGESYFS